MDTVGEILILVWWWYLVPGLGFVLATVVTEILMIRNTPPDEKYGLGTRIMALAFAFLYGLWRWPLNLIYTARTYFGGDTLLAQLAKNQDTRLGWLEKVKSRDLPIARRWEILTNMEGIEYHVFVADFHTAPGKIPERRMTHVIRFVKGSQASVLRCLPDFPGIPFAQCRTLIEAKSQCEADTDWLTLGSPNKDADRPAALQALIERQRHPA